MFMEEKEEEDKDLEKFLPAWAVKLGKIIEESEKKSRIRRKSKL